MDYAKPINPGDVLRYAAKRAHNKAQSIRRAVDLMKTEAETLEQFAYDVESEADRFDKYQPQASDFGGYLHPS